MFWSPNGDRFNHHSMNQFDSSGVSGSSSAASRAFAFSCASFRCIRRASLALALSFLSLSRFCLAKVFWFLAMSFLPNRSLWREFESRRPHTAWWPTATAHSRWWCAGAGETRHRLLRCSRYSPRRSRSGRHHAKANAASTGTLDKQESRRIRCVPNRRRRLSRAVNATDGWQQKCAATGRHTFNGVQEDPALSESPVRSENAFHSHEQRYSLVSDRFDPASRRRPKSTE